MDRKIIKKNTHSDRPEHQRWLYVMSDWGMGKAVLFIWLICAAIIILTLLGLKLIFSIFK
jgi:hypothetical protein